MTFAPCAMASSTRRCWRAGSPWPFCTITWAFGASFFIASTKNGPSRLSNRIVVELGSRKNTFLPPSANAGAARAVVNTKPVIKRFIISSRCAVVGAASVGGALPGACPSGSCLCRSTICNADCTIAISGSDQCVNQNCKICFNSYSSAIFVVASRRAKSEGRLRCLLRERGAVPYRRRDPVVTGSSCRPRSAQCPCRCPPRSTLRP